MCLKVLAVPITITYTLFVNTQTRYIQILFWLSEKHEQMQLFVACQKKKEKLLTIRICYEVTPRAWATATNKGPSSKEYC